MKRWELIDEETASLLQSQPRPIEEISEGGVALGIATSPHARFTTVWPDPVQAEIDPALVVGWRQPRDVAIAYARGVDRVPGRRI